MRYKQFQASVYESAVGLPIANRATCYGHVVLESADGAVFVDGEATSYCSLEEAKRCIKQERQQRTIQREIQQEIYDQISDNKVAAIIRSHHGNIRVTDTLIESYVELASSKLFTLDPVAHDIRQINKLDQVLEGKIDYRLNDGTVMMIDEETRDNINKVFGQHGDVVEYMRESAENFLSVVHQLEE